MTASWQTSVSGIATIVAGVANLIIEASREGTVSTGAIGIALTAVLAGIGLMAAKDNNVSNSPHPLANAQAVIPVTEDPPKVAVPLAHPVPTIEPIRKAPSV